MSDKPMTGSFYPRPYRNALPASNRLARAAWSAVGTLLFRLSPTPFFAWRRLLLRAFGAHLAATAKVYPTVEVWAPWNLVMEDGSCLGPRVKCYDVDRVVIEAEATVSDGAFLCTASHDIHRPEYPLVTSPIRIGRGAVVFVEAFIGPGVTVGEGAVVGARAVVMKSVAPYQIVAGNPSREIGTRRYRPFEQDGAGRTNPCSAP